MLSLRSVSKVFGGQDDGLTPVLAVDAVSLEVGAGEFFSLIGARPAAVNRRYYGLLAGCCRLQPENWQSAVKSSQGPIHP